MLTRVRFLTLVKRLQGGAGRLLFARAGLELLRPEAGVQRSGPGYFAECIRWLQLELVCVRANRRGQVVHGERVRCQQGPRAHDLRVVVRWNQRETGRQ